MALDIYETYAIRRKADEYELCQSVWCMCLYVCTCIVYVMILMIQILRKYTIYKEVISQINTNCYAITWVSIVN